MIDSEWKSLNEKAEELARREPTPSVPSLDHLTYKDFEVVYEPAADTFLLLDALRYELFETGIFHGRKDPVMALEIGCGTGVPSVYLRNKWGDGESYARPPLLSFVTDINPRALSVCCQTAHLNQDAKNPHPSLEAVRCDLASAFLPRLQGGTSILLFNPPYVPTPDEEVGSSGIEASWAGGKDGRRVIDRALDAIPQLLERPDGVAYVVTVDDNKPPELATRFHRLGLDMRPLFRRRAHNEFLTIQKVTWANNMERELRDNRNKQLQSDATPIGRSNAGKKSTSVSKFPNGSPCCSPMRPPDDPETNVRYISVVSYNVLAPCYVRPLDKRTGNVQPFAAFEWVKDCDAKDVLEMEQRGPILLKVLQSCQADVICLQELQLKRDEKTNNLVLPTWILPLVQDHCYQVRLPPQGELEIIAQRNGRVLDIDAAVTCAILYRVDRLEVADDVKQTSAKDTDTSTCVSLCIKAKLGSMDPVVVTCVHLDATDEKKRIGQLTRCLRRARQLGNGTTVKPISTIIAGDMNQEFNPGSAVAGFLPIDLEVQVTEGDRERECALSHRYNQGQTPTKEEMDEWNGLFTQAQSAVRRDFCVSLGRIETGATRSAYDHDDNGQRSMKQWRLDHILYTPDTLQPCAHWATLEDDPESCVTGLPNHRHGSDHMPIAAVFQVMPTPRLSDEERRSQLNTLSEFSKRQQRELTELQNRLDSELAEIEAHIGFPEERNVASLKRKKKQRKSPPPKETIEFLRNKRSMIRDLRKRQKEERIIFVGSLGDLQRLLIEQTYGCNANLWIERGW